MENNTEKDKLVLQETGVNTREAFSAFADRISRAEKLETLYKIEKNRIKRWKILTLSFGLVGIAGLAVGITFAVTKSQTENNLKLANSELELARQNAISLQTQLAQTISALGKTQNQLAETQEQLSKTMSENDNAKEQSRQYLSEVNALQERLRVLNAQLAQVQTKLAQTWTAAKEATTREINEYLRPSLMYGPRAKDVSVSSNTGITVTFINNSTFKMNDAPTMQRLLTIFKKHELLEVIKKILGI